MREEISICNATTTVSWFSSKFHHVLLNRWFTGKAAVAANLWNNYRPEREDRAVGFCFCLFVCVCVKEQSTVLFHVLLLVTHTHNEGEARTHSSKVNSSGTRVGSHTDLRLEVCGQRWILVKEQKLNWKNKCVKHQLHTNVSHSSVQPGRKG